MFKEIKIGEKKKKGQRKKKRQNSLVKTKTNTNIVLVDCIWGWPEV